MKKIYRFIDKNKFPLLVFFSSLFIFISLAGTRLFFSDEGVILDQFFNLIHGSLALKFAKINTVKGVFILVGNNLYGIFSYSLLLLSVPVYFLLSIIDLLFGVHLFLLLIWAFCGGIIVYLIAKIRQSKFAGSLGSLMIFMLLAINLYLFKPIYFPKWGELLSIEFTNILISAFLVLIIYLFFKELFGNKIGLFASFFVIIATPISFYAITLKHHSLSLFLTVLAFYCFFKYIGNKQNKSIHIAYILAGLCVWVRILDGAVLLFAIFIADILLFKRSRRYIINILIIIFISLLPFFTFNYMVLNDPFSIIEKTPLTDKSVSLIISNDFISLDESPHKDNQAELLNQLGFIWNTNINANWLEIMVYALFSKLNNTFGVFLISPFLIIALSFIIDRIKWKVKLNELDKFFVIYVLLLLGAYSLLQFGFNINSLITIIMHTPIVLEYRYLMVLYIVLLYFVFRINTVRKLIEDKFKTIFSIYGVFLILNLIIFAVSYPINFLKVYYIAATGTSIILLFLVSMSLLKRGKIFCADLPNDPLTIFIAFALAEASTILIFYFWIVNMTYISPQLNFMIVPVLENINKMIFQNII
jgi:4-amino-4-deoxy-L-arabinose transferase-like glycosyltransferase